MSYCADWLPSALSATIRVVGLASRISLAARTPPPPGMSKSSSDDVRAPVRGQLDRLRGVLASPTSSKPLRALRAARTA